MLALGGNAGAAEFSYGAGADQFIYEVDYAVATVTPLWDTGITWFGATDGVEPNTFYATPSGGGLYTVNVVAQTVTLVGTYNGPAIDGLALNEDTGVLYGTDDFNLYTISQVDGSPTFIGSIGLLNSVWALDYERSTGRLIGVDSSSASMYEISMIDGATSIIGSTQQSRITDIWYDEETDRMFGVGNFPDQFYELDTTTGAATAVGSITGANILGLGLANLNSPPDCSRVVADPDEIWPPDHRFVDVSVAGVTDPDGDPVTITITGIAQDEPLEGLGDGNTCPDADGIGTDIAVVRAERSGTKKTPGDGRVYHGCTTGVGTRCHRWTRHAPA
jgi:hypothetical protein